MVDLARKAGARVLVVGMEVPPNYGGDYARRFSDLFAGVAKRHQAALVPFLLAGIADAPDPLKLFQSDRLHPREEAQPRILENVWPELHKLLVPQPARVGPAPKPKKAGA
jgi:acyl-CoA thioesterase-1